MKQLRLILFVFIATVFINGCSNVTEALTVLTSQDASSSHPLKSKKDLQIEKLIATGTWKYQPQAEDCEDTTWEQSFHKNRYYQSIGSACQLVDAFSVEAESWHVKNQNLYIVNLSSNDNDDIIIKYQINYLDNNKLVLTSENYRYEFLR